MNKKELLKHFNVSSLADISDEDLIKLASKGNFGIETKYSVCASWAYDSKHDLAEHIRIALEKGKQLRTCVYGGEGVYVIGKSFYPTQIEIDYV